MEKKIELSTLLGILAALCMVIAAITFSGQSQILSFIDLPSMMIVFGGTFFVTCASFSISDVIKALSVSSQTMFFTPIQKGEITAISVRLADRAKRKGILSLQKNSQAYASLGSFFKKHLTMIIDGISAADIEKILVKEIVSIRDRHRKSADILRKAAEVSPAMGLVGTLIGLVQMLGSLNDPGKIGPAMAIALLTTLYGAVTAYIILIPLSQKLERNSKEEVDILKIYADALIAIASQEGPVRLEMKMNASLAPEERIKIYS